MYCPNCFDKNFTKNKCTICGYIKPKITSNLYLKTGIILNNQYLIGKILGKGGFGVTYIAYNQNAEKKVAIKEYLPSNLVSRNNNSSDLLIQMPDDKARYEKYLNKFYDEAKLLTSFSEIEGIVNVSNFFFENKTGYMVMEYIEGTTLKEYIKLNGNLSFDDLINLLTPVINSLSLIHEKRLLHRDISPDNIMISKNKLSVLIDFGAARYALNNANNNLSIILKPGFAPIEQYTNKDQGPWTDIYALAATIYYSITKTTPIFSIYRSKNDSLEKPTNLVDLKYINKLQETVLLKALAVKGSDRYLAIKEFVKDINKISNNKFKETLTLYKGTKIEFEETNSAILYEEINLLNKENKKNKFLILVISSITLILCILFLIFILLFYRDNNINTKNKTTSTTSISTEDKTNTSTTDKTNNTDDSDVVSTAPIIITPTTLNLSFEEFKNIYKNSIEISTLKGSSMLNSIDYNPKFSNDAILSTGWVEGAKGNGYGEYLEYTFNTSKNTSISKINIYNGYLKSDELWNKNSRVKKLNMYVDNTLIHILNLEDTKLLQKFSFSAIPIDNNTKIKLEIIEIYGGNQYTDTVITELNFQ
jgi:serine/threonine protein kinase